MLRQWTWRHMARVTMQMGWSDFSMKYRGSVLGYLWSLMLPLMKFLVIYFIFQPFIGESIPLYPLYLFLGIVIWEHFALTTSACLSVPFDKAAIIQNIRFPRWLLLPIVGWTHAMIFISYLLIFELFAFIFGLVPSWNTLYIIIIILQLSFLAMGVGGCLGAFVLKFRDLKHLWDMLLTVFFWLTPIMYPYRTEGPFLQEIIALPTKLLPPNLGEILSAFIRFQPLSVILHDARRALLYPDIFGIPTLLHTTAFTAFCLAFGAAGLYVFHRRSRYFLEEY